MKVVVVGGGWGGCAAALAAKKAGAEVKLLERTDLLLGTGLVGGIYRNNGRYTAAQEMIEMGGGELFECMDNCCKHQNVSFPGHQHASLYDVTIIEPKIRRLLEQHEIEIRFTQRVVMVNKYAKKICEVTTDNGQSYAADVFIDATGTAGPMGSCLIHGNGCAMCVLRCPAFGPRVSLTAKAEIQEFMGQKEDGTFGAMSGSCKLSKSSLAPEIVAQLDREGVVVIKLPAKFNKSSILGKKACTQYALPDYAKNIVLLDTGHAKMMTSYFSLEDLRSIPGFENAVYVDPYAGGKGNSIRYTAISPCDCFSMKVTGLDNLFCCGEKAGLYVGHTEAVVTGSLAGNNAVRHVLDMKYLKIPSELACGDIIEFVDEQMKKPNGLKKRYSFSGSSYFERMKQLNLYSTDRAQIYQSVAKFGMSNVFGNCLV